MDVGATSVFRPNGIKAAEKSCLGCRQAAGNVAMSLYGARTQAGSPLLSSEPVIFLVAGAGFVLCDLFSTDTSQPDGFNRGM